VDAVVVSIVAAAAAVVVVVVPVAEEEDAVAVQRAEIWKYVRPIGIANRVTIRISAFDKNAIVVMHRKLAAVAVVAMAMHQMAVVQCAVDIAATTIVLDHIRIRAWIHYFVSIVS